MRSWEMKLPEEPESTKAEAAMDLIKVSSCTFSTVSLAIIESVCFHGRIDETYPHAWVLVLENRRRTRSPGLDTGELLESLKGT